MQLALQLTRTQKTKRTLSNQIIGGHSKRNCVIGYLMKRKIRMYGKPLPAKRDVQATMAFYEFAANNEGVKMSELTFQELRQANTDRVNEFGHGNLTDGWNVAEWGCALAGETGELCNVLKKIIRQTDIDPCIDDLTVMADEEIADVAIYLDLLAAKLGINLADAIRRKFNATSEKHGFPQRL